MQKKHPHVVYQSQFDHVNVRAYRIFSGSMQEWSHKLCRKVLAELLEQEENAIQITREPGQKPSHPGIDFNIAHTENIWIIAWSRVSPVGVDIEKIRVIDYQLILKRFLPKITKKHIQDVKDFFKLWTQQEALVKFYGLSFAHIPKIDIAEHNIACASFYFENQDVFQVCCVYKQ